MTSLQNLFVGLVINKHNIQILHWNTAGVDFDPVHEKLADYISQFEEYIDEVAESARMNGETVFNFANVYANAESADTNFLMLDDTALYYSAAIWSNCETIFNGIMELYDAAIKDESLPSDVVSKLEEHQYWFRLENRFKNDSRIASSTPSLQSEPYEDDAPVEDHMDDAGMVYDDDDVDDTDIELINEPDHSDEENEPAPDIAPTDDFVDDELYDENLI